MSVRYDKVHKRWIADYYDASGKRHQPTFETRRGATDELSAKRLEIRRGTFLDPAQVPCLEEVATAWLKGKGDRRPSSVAGWEVHVHTHIIPVLGRYRVTDVKVAIVERLRDSLREHLGPQTVNKVLTTLTAIFDLAMRRGYAMANPAAATERLRSGSAEIMLGDRKASRHKAGEVSPEEILSPEQTARLLEAAEPGYHRTLFTMLAATGARIGEVLALTWSEVDLEAATITIRRGVSHARTRAEKEAGMKARARFFGPKTESGVRTLPAPPELVSELRRWKLACPPTRAGLVFPNAVGTAAHRKTVWARGFRPALTAAKLPSVTIHSLRHTFASALIMHGAPLTEVAYLLGHASPEVTSSVYAHWFRDVKTDTVASYVRTLFSARDSSRIAADGGANSGEKVVSIGNV